MYRIAVLLLVVLFSWGQGGLVSASTIGIHLRDGSGFVDELSAGIQSQAERGGDQVVINPLRGPGAAVVTFINDLEPAPSAVVAVVTDPDASIDTMEAAGIQVPLVFADMPRSVTGATAVGTDQSGAGNLIGRFACTISQVGQMVLVSKRSEFSPARAQGVRDGIASGCRLSVASEIDLSTDPFGLTAVAVASATFIVALDEAAKNSVLDARGSTVPSAIPLLCVLCSASSEIGDDGVLAMTVDDPFVMGQVAAMLAHALANSQEVGSALVPAILVDESGSRSASIELSIGGETILPPNTFRCYEERCDFPESTRCQGGGQDGSGLCVN